jgi:ATP-dependent exoDNAse (exonuclease V) beta subunit
VDWVRLAKISPSAKLSAAVEPLKTAASAHVRHPRLRTDLERWTTLLFDVAARALERFQQWKRERRLMDFVDQEAMVLSLLGRADSSSMSSRTLRRSSSRCSSASSTSRRAPNGWAIQSRAFSRSAGRTLR